MATESPAVGTKYCSACGSEISAEAEICPDCGVAQDTAKRRLAPEPSGRWLSAVIGGIVTFFLSWLPFIGVIVGPIGGGFTAGFLRGANVKESALTGTLANVLASIPGALLVVLLFFLGGLGIISDGTGEAAFGLFVWAVIFLFSFVVFYLLGAIGGVIGAKVTSRGDPMAE